MVKRSYNVTIVAGNGREALSERQNEIRRQDFRLLYRLTAPEKSCGLSIVKMEYHRLFVAL